jgi:tryptophan 2,3-dioxygenase
MDQEIKDRVLALEQKYAAMGQDLKSYLDGLLISNYLTYWDYIQLDTLLTLQKPKTDFPDEMIFVVYHQITELYFKLALHEFNQIAHNGRNVLPNGEDLGWKSAVSKDFIIDRVKRINQYFAALTKSFDIMVLGMEKEQFLRYRMALLPASGFQSAQYRKIEISSTDFINLVSKDARHLFRDNEANAVTQMFEHIYWKQGATELSTGKKTLTLKQFEKKYADELIEMADYYKERNVWAQYKSISPDEQADPNLRQALRQLDINVNVNWPLVHYKSAVRYLAQDSKEVAATGGTNWQKYLPPRFQKRIFYPELWNEEELENWGKAWVEEVLAEGLKS